jgi:single-strand DNA-binding protein
MIQPRKDIHVMSTTITTEANLTGDPELRFTKTTGQAVCTVRLAVSTRRKNMDGEYDDTVPVFYEATVWGQLAEHLADTAGKGDRLLVHGTTHDEQWTDRDGGTRIKHVIQVTALGASLRYATATIHRATRAQSQSESAPAEIG